MAGLQGWHLVILVVLLVLLFGAPKLPSMARNLGQSMRIFSSEVKQMRAEDKPASGAGSSAAPEVVERTVVEPAEGRVVEHPQRPTGER